MDTHFLDADIADIYPAIAAYFHREIEGGPLRFESTPTMREPSKPYRLFVLGSKPEWTEVTPAAE